MPTLRSTTTPIEHLTAEVAAMPFASDAAFELALLELDPILTRSPSTAAVWRDAERRLATGGARMSLDELTALRDRMWFADSCSRRVRMHEYLHVLGEKFLVHNGYAAYPRPLVDTTSQFTATGDAATVRARTTLRWLLFALPRDLLLAGLDPSDAGPSRIERVTPAMSTLLNDRGFAEPHQHLSAGLGFATLWALVTRGLRSTALDPSRFDSPGSELGSGIEVGLTLLRACTVRVGLAAYLTAGKHWRAPYADFRSFVETVLVPRVARSLGAPGIQNLRETFRGAVADRRRPSSRADFSLARRVYRELTTTYDRRRQIDTADVMRADPIAIYFEPDGVRESAELRFIRACLRSIHSGAVDVHFERTFWQLERVRVRYYRHIVQRPMTPGLQWFVRHFGRIHAGVEHFPLSALMDSAAVLAGRGFGLRSLETRISPGRTARANTATLQRVRDTAKRWSEQPGQGDARLEVGVVMHFTKDRGGGVREGRPNARWVGTEVDPARASRGGSGKLPELAGWRCETYLRSRMSQARALARTISRRPDLLQILRGIDVCSDEQGLPTWALTDAVQLVKRTSAREANRSRVPVDASGVPSLMPLRTTVHAGEDFVHLLTGLRLIDEALDQFSMREGDRIGHGLALGIDPIPWSVAAARVPLPVEVRLFDLVWQWSWHSSAGCAADGALPPRIEAEIAALSEVLFGKAVSPHALRCLQLDLSDARLRHAANYPVVPGATGGWNQAELDALLGDGERSSSGGNRARIELLETYLSDRQVFDRGQQIVWVETAAEGPAIDALQRALRMKVTNRGIAIEVNPTSNLLIGDLGDMSQHPMWRLRPPVHDPDLPPLAVCIGSDDPVTFGSSLREEYQSVYDALIDAGNTAEIARDWLESARVTGMEYRFTRPLTSGLG